MADLVTENPPGAGNAGTGTGDGRPPGHPYRRRAISLVVACALAVALAAVLFDNHSSSTGGGSTDAIGDTAPGVGPASAALMQLNVIPASQAITAPAVDDLVDQHGRPFSWASIKGKVVIWSLNDDQCTDLCSLFAEDVVTADRDLGQAAKDVVFVSVNANPFYPSPASTLAWSETNDVESLPNWVYLTGTPAQLEQTWQAYKVTVIQDAKDRTVTHDASVQFIDPQGKIRDLGYFDTGAISTAYYGHAMAQLSDDLLPASEQVAVGGPNVLSSSTLGATVGQNAPSFDLKALGGSAAPVSLAGADSKPLVVNFWSSTCSVCVQEMPALQQTYDQFGGQLNMVGIDVADPRSTAASFASHLGVHYQLVADPNGDTAAAYRVSSLPVTFIVDTDGKILARNEGPLTASELEAVLEMDFPQLPQS